MNLLEGKVCLVIGAYYGIGRGIALQFGAEGATVYLTAPTLDGEIGEALKEVANDVRSRGGRGVTVACECNNETQVAALFTRIGREHMGRLDIMVNGDQPSPKSTDAHNEFWEGGIQMFDSEVNLSNLRSTYMCCVHAAKFMIHNHSGLIVNVATSGAQTFSNNVPFGMVNAALHRMTSDMARQLKSQNLTIATLCHGPIKNKDGQVDPKVRAVHRTSGESIEFAGKCLVAMAMDQKGLINKSGRMLVTADLGEEYRLADIDGRYVSSSRALSTILHRSGWQRTAWFIPLCVKIPSFLMAFGSKK